MKRPLPPLFRRLAVLLALPASFGPALRTAGPLVGVFLLAVQGSAEPKMALHSKPVGKGKWLVTWSTANGMRYRLERSVNLVDWDPVTTVTASDVATTFTDQEVPGGVTEVFWRVLRLGVIDLEPLAAYDATSLSGLAAGASIARLPDSSGKELHATGAGATAPTYLPDDGNGHPCLVFNGTSQFLTLPTGLRITDDVTVFAVLSRTTLTGRMTFLGCRDAAASPSFETDGQVVASTFPVGYLTKSRPFPEVAVDRPQIVSFRRGTGGTNTMDCNDLPSDNLVTPPGGSFSGTGKYEIGRRNSSGLTQYHKGKIYALYVYPRLTDVERARVSRMLGDRYMGHLGKSFVAAHRQTYQLNLPTGALVQGIIRIDDGIWVVCYSSATLGGNAMFRKYRRDADGEFVLLSTHDLTAHLPVLTGGGNARQMNGLDYREGYLYVGANNYTGSQSNKQGWILKVRAQDMVVVQTAGPFPGEGEGGAWRLIDGRWNFFAINHSDNVCHQLDENLTLITSHPMPAQGHPSNGYYYQSAMWLGDYLITPNHNAGNEGIIDIHKWNGTTFVAAQRMSAPIVYPGMPISLSGQGMCWDLPPGVQGQYGDTAIIVRRSGTGEALAMTLSMRSTNLNPVAN